MLSHESMWNKDSRKVDWSHIRDTREMGLQNSHWDCQSRIDVLDSLLAGSACFRFEVSAMAMCFLSCNAKFNGFILLWVLNIGNLTQVTLLKSSLSI